MNHCILGYNGERQDPSIRSIYLNNSYRVYSQTLERFISPDNWSPFDRGGINPYAYCEDDPVNRADPSGHMSWQAITGITIGAIGLLMIPLTLGQSLTVTACITASMEMLSGASSIASAVTEKGNSRVSAILGWVSLATGIVAGISGLGAGGKTLLNAFKAKANQLVDAFSGGLSPMADDMARASQLFMPAMTNPNEFRLPSGFSTLQRQYEHGALRIASQNQLPLLGWRRIRTRYIPTLGEHVRTLRGARHFQKVPAYSRDLRLIAPLNTQYDDILKEAYRQWGLPESAYNFRLTPEPLPEYSVEDNLNRQAILRSNAPPPYSEAAEEYVPDMEVTRM